MRILLTGATGYVGKRILGPLLDAGHTVICCTRDISRFNTDVKNTENIEVIEVDFLKEKTLQNIPLDIDGAYYLIHSMSTHKNFTSIEEITARSFVDRINETQCQHVVYLSGIVNDEDLSEHLASRKAVERILSSAKFKLTTLRAGIIIGSGSASFEIIRDLVEKLPFMIAPKWLNTKCQPIGIRDVLAFLQKSLLNEVVYGKHYDIGGPDILSYKEMLLGYAEARGLKRKIIIVPVMTPKISSYWLYFITSTSYRLATSLVHSMKVEVVCEKSKINSLLGIQQMPYKTALNYTLNAVDKNNTTSSWKDAFVSSNFKRKLSDFIEVPKNGCFIDQRDQVFFDKKTTLEKIWSIGGKNGWYYGNWLWRFRGFLDKVFGGVGLRRGRTHPTQISVGDTIDFWRVLDINKKEGRLLLFAEMKLPGEAWLEFKIVGNNVVQTATFRPKGLLGRLYWYGVLPFHGFIFKGMLRNICDD